MRNKHNLTIGLHILALFSCCSRDTLNCCKTSFFLSLCIHNHPIPPKLEKNSFVHALTLNLKLPNSVEDVFRKRWRLKQSGKKMDVNKNYSVPCFTLSQVKRAQSKLSSHIFRNVRIREVSFSESFTPCSNDVHAILCFWQWWQFCRTRPLLRTNVWYSWQNGKGSYQSVIENDQTAYFVSTSIQHLAIHLLIVIFFFS